MEISETDVQSAAEIKETLPAMAADNPEQIRQERKTPATVGKKLFRQTLGKGLPKRWKGGGDYFFEQQEDGSLKITGGDKARNLTGGKSVVITDSEKLKEIYQKAQGGDVLEADVTYKAEEKEEDTTFRGGGSPGLEYLNETESDAVLEAERDPEATQLDSGTKRLQAVRTHRDIIEKEIPEMNDQMTREILEKPEFKILADTIDRLSAQASEDPSLNEAIMALADLLTKKVKQERGF